MTMSATEVHRLWHEAQHLPRGRAKFEAIDAVLRHADAAGLAQEAFNFRLSALSEFHHGGDPTRLFLAFTHCLRTWDADPSVGHGHAEHTLLWTFKWIAWSLPQFPEIPLDRTAAVLDDMEQRYRRAGHSLHAVYQHRWLVAHHTGDPAADDWYAKLVTTARDRMSDCAACVPSGQVRHLVSRHRDEEAIEIGSPYSRGGCTEQPHWMLSELLLPYLRTGRIAEATDAHRVGYPPMRSDRHHLDNIAQHVWFCGLSGNEPRGLELVDRHRAWLAQPPSPYAAMMFAASGAQVLGRLAAAGHGDAPVVPVPGSPATTVAETHAELAAMAREIAARFDARNGNGHVSGLIEARMAAEPLADRADLSVAARPRETMTRQVAAHMDDALAARAAGDPAAAGEALIAAADELERTGGWQTVIETVEEAVALFDRASATGPAQLGRARLARLYERMGRHDEAAATVDGLLREPALPPGAPSRGELLAAAARLHADRDQAAPLHRDAAEALVAEGNPGAALDTLLIPLQQGAADDAMLALAQRLAEQGDADDPAWHPRLAVLDLAAAWHWLSAGQLDAALGHSRRGLDLGATGCVLPLAGALLRLGQPDEALRVARTTHDAEEDDYEAVLALGAVLHATGQPLPGVLDEWGVDPEQLDDLLRSLGVERHS
ncbi:hypothetical protein [Dactylosporangium sp. NPDC000521]|uniref:hypothetical protein n=1 Tax=Dactylosporangium sp. NPDC000521 TaxID=3363975 RepID=UPI0036938AB7